VCTRVRWTAEVVVWRRTLVGGEAALEVDLLDLLLEEVALVEEQYYRLVGVPPVRGDIEEVERLLEPVLLDVLAQHL